MAASKRLPTAVVWDGKVWSEIQTVARRSDFDVYAEAPPSVLKLANGMLLSLWGQKIKTGGKWDGSYLFSTISADGGKHWSHPVRVHSDASLSEHSFSSMAPADPDRALVVWLDARDDEAMHRYRLMSAVIDSKGTVSDERTVDEDTCTCCPTALVTTPALAIAAYRGHDSEEIRDIKLSRLTGGTWETPRAVHDDNWHINGCPVNGPALSVNGDNLGVIWFTGKDDKPQVEIAASQDLGKSFQTAQLLDSPQAEGRPVGHTTISMLGNETALAVWVQQGTSEARILGQFISFSGRRRNAFTIARGTSRGLGYPRLQAFGAKLMLSWSGSNGKEVKTAIISE